MKAKFLATLLLIIGSSASYAAPSADPWQFWQTSDESNDAEIDHAIWQNILSRYVRVGEDGINLFAYESASQSSNLELNDYIQYMQGVDPRSYSLGEQRAYWINLYNALTVDLIIENYPVESITKLGGGFFRFGPWDDEIAQVAGEKLTLNDIEHRILRPIWKDARIHFTVNCASIGCPNLQPVAFTKANMESLLQEAASEYLSHPRCLDFDDSGKLTLSSIFEWYAEDFGSSNEEMLVELSEFVTAELAEELREYMGRISYQYDWSLNE